MKPERDADGGLQSNYKQRLWHAFVIDMYFSSKVAEASLLQAGKYTSENWEKGDATVITPKSGTPYTVRPAL